MLLSFQLSPLAGQVAEAAQRLPVLKLDEAAGPAFQKVLKAVDEAGYAPRTMREQDFLFNITPQGDPYVLVPLSGTLDQDTLAMLRRYVHGGGRLVLIAPETPLTASLLPLFELIGLPVCGRTEARPDCPFRWQGMALPGAEALPEHSPLLVLDTHAHAEVLATWGDHTPAVAMTEQGAVLNWPWGRQLTAPVNTIALSQVMPLAKPDSFMFLQQRDESPRQASPGNSWLSIPPQATVAAVKAARPLPPVKAGPNPLLKAADHSRSPASGAAQKPIESKPAAIKETADDEVLNNILGTPAPAAPHAVKPNAGQLSPDDPLLKDKLEGGGATTMPQPASEAKQKHFSFLDPEAAAVLAPAFDYGVYSLSLRVLDDYKRRIRDAVETSRQLGLEIPEEKVNALLKDSDQHKRRFESLYLNNQTQEGLSEFSQARRLALQAIGLTSASPKVEGRAIWLDRATIIDAGNATELRKRIQKLHQAGINIVYFETLNAGFPIYPSAILKNNPMVQGWDPLKVAVEEGHKLGMEVHAWVWAFAVGNRRHNPLIHQPADYAGPILTEGGLMSDALRNREGGLIVDNKQNEFWISPASAKGRDFLLSVYKEIVSNYDVDGLQLDYIRYPFQTYGTRMGYEAVGRERFNKSTGASVDGGDDYTAKLWVAWKTYQVSSFVQQVSATLKQIRPTLKLSAAVFPMKREARIVAIQQDWETWIDHGWIDTLSPMSYTSDPERLQGMFEYVQGSPQKHSLIYPGIALHRLDGGQLVLELEALREKGSLGSTLFAGAHLDSEKVETLGNGPFKEHASITPHKDVVKALQTLLADYQTKFESLKAKNALPPLSREQTTALEGGLSQFAATLSAIGPTLTFTDIPAAKVQQAQQALKALQAQTQNWLTLDKAAHPFRAQYFGKNILLLNELLGYLADKATPPVTAFHPPPGVQSATSQPAPSLGLMGVEELDAPSENPSPTVAY